MSMSVEVVKKGLQPLHQLFKKEKIANNIIEILTES